MKLIDKDAVIKALLNLRDFNAALDAINALPVKYPFNPDWSPIEAIRETIKERDDAFKEVERLKARLALAEEVMEKMANYIRSEDETSVDILADYGWTKEDGYE